MIHLYGMGSPNVVKVLIMLEEIGLPYEFTRVDVMAGEQFSADFVRLNPNAKVPVIIDHDVRGEPLAVFESCAILLYLAEKTGVLWSKDLLSRTRCTQWLMFQMASFGPMSGQAIHFNYATKEDSYARSRYTNELNRLIAVVEQRLEQSPYIAGADYSLADIALFPWIRTLHKFFEEQVKQPRINQWFERIAARPAVEEAVEFAAQLSVKDWDAMRLSDRSARDRYFGRTPRQPA